MRRFMVIENENIDNASSVSERIRKYLDDKGATCAYHKGFVERSDIGDDTECIISLGGDGTIISTAAVVAERGIPIIGINLGHLGYLTAISKSEDIEGMLDALIDDKFDIEERMVIKGILKGQDGSEKDCYALNEIVVSRNMDVSFKAIRFDVTVNDEILNEYSADGIIVATPTGSTAYSLSAGGPVAEPDSRMIIVTPICPHSLGHISLVLSDTSCVEVAYKGTDKAEQVVISDGNQVAFLSRGDKLIVTKAEYSVRLIQLKAGIFLDNLRNKLAGV